ncbi:RNA 2',3'-cyclic phosphodiesterase [Vibrio sp. ABG19]|uniref:RNA 2',3'-cyclic phosphodiesterase n=1 Tax=Vibrio sp. ABG19 TaxID=2817385 RepID=UPI00249DDF9F|nr:RNA 2',3'-cyclic phosphodiesterase [Vibrio sp. ABG19]WGY45372.1 RNA 2',3'-cyclic phosphodiesterase [Vibrio sp. ABG19]
MSDNTRCFFALTFDTKAQEMLQRSRDTLKRNAAHGSFTHDGNFHLTLEFIGAVSDADLAQLGVLLTQLESEPPHLLHSRQLGHFDIKGGRLIWLGVKPDDRLMALQAELRGLLALNGFTPENRRYRPHITLGRRVELYQPMDALGMPDTDLSVHSVALMESAHVNGKLRYQPRYERLVAQS